MAKDDQEEALEKILSASLSRVIDFNKFAEAKNAALLTFCSAWILAIANILAAGKALPFGLATTLPIIFPFFVAAAVISLHSFLPQVRIEDFLHDGGLPTNGEPSSQQPSPEQAQRKNLIFFGEIASMNVEDFKKDIQEKYKPLEEKSTTSEYIEDMSVQIYVISKITSRKLDHFNTGAKFVLFATLIGIVVELTRIIS